MATYPIQKVDLPLDLIFKPNGKLPNELLFPVVGGGKLHALACWWFTVMRNEMKAECGIELTYTGTYRSYAQQVTLFNQRYTTAKVSNSSKVWNGVRYYLKPGMAMAAVPGTSNHGMALAIDLSEGGWGAQAKPLSTKALTWLRANADKYGFCWETVKEPWHVNYYKAGKH